MRPGEAGLTQSHWSVNDRADELTHPPELAAGIWLSQLSAVWPGESVLSSLGSLPTCKEGIRETVQNHLG